MGEDYWDDWTLDRKKGPKPADMNGFTHIQQPLTTLGSIEQVQHDTHKVAIVKDCYAFPGLRRTL